MGKMEMISNVLIWRDWPAEKPPSSKWYLVEEANNGDLKLDRRSFDDRLGMELYDRISDEWSTHGLIVVRWADVPNPYD